jgi:hypothetical protein
MFCIEKIVGIVDEVSTRTLGEMYIEYRNMTSGDLQSIAKFIEMFKENIQKTIESEGKQ